MGEPIADALDPCPACDALDWEEALGDVRCVNCGHELAPGGVWFPGPGGPPPSGTLPKPAAPRLSPAEKLALHKRRLDQLDDLTGPVYAPPGGEPQLRGHGGPPGQTDRVALQVGDVVVDTRHRDYRDAETLARTALESGHWLGEWPSVSPPALRIWLDARRRERVAAIRAAPLGSVQIEVDGEPRAFVCIALGDDWAASWNGITVSGRGPVPTRLVQSGSAS